MAKKTKNEFDGLTVDELKARRDECQSSIDELLGKRQKLDDKIHIDILNGNLKRIMNKWVKVKNYTWTDESNEEVYGYRVFKVVGVESWVQDNRFKIAIEKGVFFGKFKDWALPNKMQEVVIIGNQTNYETGDITKWQVISQRQARTFIRNVADKISKTLGWMQFEMGD